MPKLDQNKLNRLIDISFGIWKRDKLSSRTKQFLTVFEMETLRGYIEHIVKSNSKFTEKELINIHFGNWQTSLKKSKNYIKVSELNSMKILIQNIITEMFKVNNKQKEKAIKYV